jgi:hypothetical protein
MMQRRLEATEWSSRAGTPHGFHQYDDFTIPSVRVDTDTSARRMAFDGLSMSDMPQRPKATPTN